MYVAPHSSTKTKPLDRLGMLRVYQQISDNMRYAFLLVFAFAFILRLLVNGLVLGFDYTGYEAHDYLALATNLLQGNGMVIQIGEPTAIRPPGYPWFITMVFAVAGVGNLAALKVAEAIVGALTACLAMLIGNQLFDRRIGLLAGLLCAIYPSQIYFSGSVFSENLFAFLLALLIYLLLRCGARPSLAMFCLCGVILGLVTLTRPLTLLLPPFILLWAWYHWRNLRLSLIATATISVCMMLTILPWTIRNQMVLGKPVLITTVGGRTFCGSNNVYVLNNPDEYGTWVQEGKLPYYLSMLRNRSEIEREEICYKMGLQFWREHPADLPGLMLAKQINFWNPVPNRDGLAERLVTVCSYGVLLPFMLVGLVIDLRRERRALLILLTILVFVINTFIFYGSTRLRAPIEPLLVIFASLGLIACLQAASVWLRGFTSHARNVRSV